MKAPAFAYHRPVDVQHALRLLAEWPGARVLAGGQSLMPMLNFRQLQVDALVDINRLSDLDYIRAEGEEIVMGALTRQRSVEFSDLVGQRLPLLAAAVRRLGHRQTRNRGTVGGSLCQMDPAAELPLIAWMYAGQVLLRSLAGDRVLPITAFAQGALRTVLAPGELLVELRLTPWPCNHGFGFHEFARRHADWAFASAAALMTLDGRGRIDRVALALGAVQDLPTRRPQAEALLLGQPPSEQLFAQAARCTQDLVAREDVASPAWYRLHLAEVMAVRALRDAARSATQQMHMREQ